MAAKTRKNDANQRFQKYYDILDAAPSMRARAAETPNTERTRISDEIAREKKLKNDDTEQDIKLKRITLNRLFGLLVGETIIVFVLAFLQATHLFGFALEEWSFKLLTSVTIVQITVMLSVAVNYLFPKKQ
jgi:hypothetical protein